MTDTEDIIKAIYALKGKITRDDSFESFNDDLWMKIIDTMLGHVLVDDHAKATYNSKFLKQGRDIILTNDEIINLMIKKDPKLALRAQQVLSEPMDGNDVYDYLNYMVRHSKYAEVLYKAEVTILLDIKDTNIDDDWFERDILGLGICKLPRSKDTNADNFQYVTYATE